VGSPSIRLRLDHGNFKGIVIPVVLATVDVFGTKDSLILFQRKDSYTCTFWRKFKIHFNLMVSFPLRSPRETHSLRHIVRHLWE